MLNQLEQAKQKWGGSHSVIDNWLDERRELLVQYCELAGLPPYGNTDSALPSAQDILRFCQIMMDYVSVGHFEVYDQIVSECEQNGCDSLELAKSLQPRIAVSTDIALAFNDKFADMSDEEALDNFDEELSKLGQALEERFELEDELIHTLYSKHV